MSARSALPQPPSPLDPFLSTLLAHLGTLPEGFSPTTDLAAIGEACDVPPAFVEALLTSARTRGLVEVFRPRGGKGRYRWRVSQLGFEWRSTRS